MKNYRTGRSGRILLWLVSMLSSAAATAQSHDAHVELVVSNQLRLSDVVAAAIEFAPEALLKEAHGEQARAYSNLAKGLTPGQATWQASYLADDWTDGQGVSETELGLEMSLWRLKERRLTSELGDSHERRAEAFDGFLRWLAAGRVRTAVAAVAAAELELERERTLSENLTEIRQTVGQLVAAGELAELELLRIEAELFEQQMAVLNANAAVVDAHREYQVITGLDAIPATFKEELGEEHETVPSTHPLLLLLAAEFEIASRDSKRLAVSSLNRSTVNVGVRREQAGAMLPHSDTLGFGVTIPLGGKRQSRPIVADARAAATRVEVELHSAKRELERQLHEAEYELSVNTEARKISEARLVLAERRAEMALTAFDEAEIDLEQVLRIRAQLVEVARAHDSLLKEQQALIAQYNQAVGEVP